MLEFKKNGKDIYIYSLAPLTLKDVTLKDIQVKDYQTWEDYLVRELEIEQNDATRNLLNIRYNECIKRDKKPTSLGVKQSRGKTRWSLLPFKAMEHIINVLDFGAVTKYAPNNWKKVENKGAYCDAIIRHTTKYMQGEENDKEVGENHLACAACNILFLLYDRDEKKNIPFEEYINNLLTYPDYVKKMDIHKFN